MRTMTEPQLAAVDERPKKTATETSQETKGEHDQHDKTPPAEVLGKAKRGRPRKKLPEKAQDDGAPVIKRPRGRPKGSKNKNPKPKPIPTGPKRPRGRPRKWPLPDASLPKRSRGRPRKNATPTTNLGLPTMVGITGEPALTNDRTTSVAAPGIVPPDDLFSNDDLD